MFSPVAHCWGREGAEAFHGKLWPPTAAGALDPLAPSGMYVCGTRPFVPAVEERNTENNHSQP
jgi:hypothetical protein